jgi:putative membrane protein insertion efficiency factor
MAAIRGYQRWLSPHLPITCRHEPSCSTYGLLAIARFGLWQGTRLTASRIQRCTRAVSPGTADPVPGI